MTETHEETGPRARDRRWYEKNPVAVRLSAEDGRTLDHHAEPLGISRRLLASRVIKYYTANAARDIAREQESRARQTRERLEGER